MIGFRLQMFIEKIAANRTLSAEDVLHLRSDVLRDGIASRQEAEALLSLDRMLSAADETWPMVLTDLIADFMVRGEQAAGGGHDAALWLTTALDLGGLTETAMAIAYAVLDRFRHADAALLDFIMRGRRQARLRELAA